MPRVTVIPSTINPLTQAPLTADVKRKVCAYARVSTDSDEQYTSYEAQVTYYKKYIQERTDWEYVDVYADEGITGTNRKRREGFNKMIKDALAGKVDLIITKSISRFARNTLDTISVTRELKAKGVEVYFEKENLWTFDSKNELVLTIMASIAQEESRSISANVTMGKRWQMQEGKVTIPFKSFLGYKKGPNGEIEVDEEQAKIVRFIYKEFLIKGKTYTAIANELNELKVPTPSGLEGGKWLTNTVISILTNEKYKGDAVLQKKFTDNYLEHTQKKNEGELPQYYVENNHPAIIKKDEWEMVQTEVQRRREMGRNYSGTSIFASRLVCEDCGGFFGKKVWHSTSVYAREIYRCNRKFDKNKKKCETPHLTEDEIKKLFIRAYNIIMSDRDRLINDTQEVIELLTNTAELDDKITSLNTELDIVSEMVRQMVNQNSKVLQSQVEYQKKYNDLATRYNKIKAKLDDCINERAYKLGQSTKLNLFLKRLEDAEIMLNEWEDEIWFLMINKAIVHKDKSITFIFLNGKEVRVYSNDATLN